MSKRFKESTERNDEGAGRRSLLSRLNSHDLKSIKVAICRHNVPEPAVPTVLQRALEDPRDLVIHRREGEGQHPIFDRRDIVVNVEKNLEERVVLKSPLRTTTEEGSASSSHPGPSKSTREQERSSKERRVNEGYRKDKYKASPKRVDYRDVSPKRYRSRSPRSPKKFSNKQTDKEKYVRPRSPPHTVSKRCSISPHNRRRSRSPHSRRHSPSPHSKRHSRSPHLKRTPPRESRRFRDSSASGSKGRRRSASPFERDRDYPSRPTSSKRRSRSPYTRKHSRSPHRTDKYRRRSRSPPFRRESDGYYRGRSRSPPRKVSKHSESEEKRYHDASLTDKSDYRGLPPEFEYYGAEGFWIPGPIPRPGFMPRGVIPPMALPRPMMRPGSYVIPRPYMPIPPHVLHPFRPRYPVGYNRPYRPRLTAPVATTSTITSATTSDVVKPTSTSTVATVSTASTSTASNPIIEEPVSESENVESPVQDKEGTSK